MFKLTKYISILFVPLFFFIFNIKVSALTSDQAYDVMMTDFVFNQSRIEAAINYTYNSNPNIWSSSYYLIKVKPQNYQGAAGYTPELMWLYFIDKTTSKITVYSSDYIECSTYQCYSNGAITWGYSTLSEYLFNGDNTLRHIYTENHEFRINNTNFSFLNDNNDQGGIMYTNVPTTYLSPNNTYLTLETRTIPWNYFPIGHPLRIEPTDDTFLDNLDNQTSSNLYISSVLSEFDFDSFYTQFTIVVNNLFSKFEDTFNSVVSVFDYIDSSFNSISLFITSNFGIVSLISLAFLALPEVIRNVFILSISTSVIFVMLRKVM